MTQTLPRPRHRRTETSDGAAPTLNLSSTLSTTSIESVTSLADWRSVTWTADSAAPYPAPSPNAPTPNPRLTARLTYLMKRWSGKIPFSAKKVGALMRDTLHKTTETAGKALATQTHTERCNHEEVQPRMSPRNRLQVGNRFPTPTKFHRRHNI